MLPKHNLPSISIEDFIGVWSLSRQIHQNLGESYFFEGKAHIEWRGTDVMYFENGVMQSENGKTLSAERTYIWQPDKDKVINVLFDDRRYFHSFSGSVTTAEHQCSDDLYKVSYDFADWPKWKSVWRVTGPKKDYQMTSLYLR